MIFLREDTASQEIPLGRFVNSTDGNTEETGLTINNTDIKIWKSGATSLVNKNSGGATVMGSTGEYYCVLDATDTDTIGPMKVSVHVAGALYVQVFCTVLDEAVYDVLFGTTAPSTLTAAGIRTAVGLASANLDTQLSTIDDFLDTEVAAIKAKTDNLPSDPADASDIAASFSTVNTKLDTIDDFLDTEIAAILADTNELQTDWADGGRLDVILDAAAALITTAMTESYASLGAAQTPAQILYEIRALLAEKTIASTTLTTKKLNGSTTARTYTLNDGTSPTAITTAS